MIDSIRLCAQVGYHYLDANLCGQCRPGQPLSCPDWGKWVDEVVEVTEESRVEIRQSHGYWPITYKILPDFSCNDEDGDILMERSIIASEALGVRWMVVHPQNYRNEDGSVDQKKSFAYNVKEYSHWGEVAAKHHVGVAIENMIKPSYANDVEDLIALVEAIDMENVRICIDTGHAHLSGHDVPSVLRRTGSMLKAMHVADNHQNADEHQPPFFGTIDWRNVVKVLEEIDYQEDFSFEIQNFTRPYPKELQPYLVPFTYHLGCLLLHENEHA